MRAPPSGLRSLAAFRCAPAGAGRPVASESAGRPARPTSPTSPTSRTGPRDCPQIWRRASTRLRIGRKRAERVPGERPWRMAEKCSLQPLAINQKPAPADDEAQLAHSRMTRITWRRRRRRASKNAQCLLTNSPRFGPSRRGLVSTQFRAAGASRPHCFRPARPAACRLLAAEFCICPARWAACKTSDTIWLNYITRKFPSSACARHQSSGRPGKRAKPENCK